MAFAASIAVAASSHAQTSPDTTSPPAASSELGALMQGGVMDQLLSVSVPRKEEEIQQLIDEAKSLERLSASELASSHGIASEADSRAKIMSEEMGVTKAKRDAAKKSKDKAAFAELDATYKKQERGLKYLEQLRDAARADEDRLQSAQAAAEAQGKALDLELKMARKRAEIGANPAGPAVTEYKNMLRQMLESQREAANRAGEASDKRKKLVEQRLKQLEALAKLGK
jgi:hypothetical protein